MHLIHSKKAKTNWGLILIVFIAFLVITGTFQITGFDFNFGTTPSDLVNVNKQIKFHFINAYSGGPIASKSNTFQLYDSDGETILEDNMDTDANGHCTTGSDFPSGKVLYVRYESSNDKQWWKFTVPQMSKADAESATYNLIRMEAFTIGTYSTDSLTYANGTSISDAGTMNISGAAEDTPHLIYSLTNTGSDNTGLMTSYDPVYDMNWNIELYVVFSGTGYERLIIYNLSWDYTLGSTHYVGATLDPYKLTKHVVGNQYRSLGRQEVSFWIDGEGQAASDSVTMQIYVYAYSDHNYAMNHGGAYGPEKVELAEHTVTIQE